MCAVGAESAYTCLGTSGDSNAQNCAGASAPNAAAMDANTGESFQTFGMTLCCKPGSGKSPKMQGFNCMCEDNDPGTCVDDYTGAILSKGGRNCFQLIEEGGGKEAACTKQISKLSAANEAKAEENGAAGIDLIVGASVACAYSCGTCPATCEDDPDGLVANNCADGVCEGVTDCASGIAKYDCDKKLSEISSKVPDLGLTIKDVCPKSCGACPSSRRLRGN